MKTVTQYKADIAALMKKVSDIDAQATVENRDLTPDELALKNEILDTVDGYQKIVDTQERQARTQAILDSPEPTRTVEKKASAQSVIVKDKEKFGSFGEQLAAIVKASSPGGHADPRLFNAASGMNEAVASDGAFMVQSDFSAQLIQDVIATGKLAARCQNIPISGNANSIKMNGVDETSRASTRYGGVIGYWKGEAAQATASKPKFREIELKPNKLMALAYLTDELMEDAPALESFVRQAFAGEFGFLIDDAIINGSGAGQPLGILNSKSLVSVAKETGQKAATIQAENIIKMYARLIPDSLGNAVWLVNQNTIPQLFTMSLSVGTGGAPVFMPAGGLSGNPYNTILGLPVIVIEQAATLGTVGDIVLADLSKYLLASKGGIKTDISIHVKFEYGEQVLRSYLRIDGQPLRSSTLTPYKGSDTISHFVALATRS